MRVLPRTTLDQIEWFESRLAAWRRDPAAVGLAPAQAAELAAAVAAARAAHEAAEIARAAAQSATVALHAAAQTMESRGRAAVAQIKAFAAGPGGPAVYAAAHVSPPADPSPAGPPPEPADVAGAIDPDGAVLLTWRGTLARRTFYEVLRRLEGETRWTLLASVGAKRYLDHAVPPGTSAASYRVRAKRGRSASAASPAITVGLGVEPTAGAGLAVAA